MATREEINKLKADWVGDPIYDLEDTEGFEEHRDELREFRAQQEAVWEKRQGEERHAAALFELIGRQRLPFVRLDEDRILNVEMITEVRWRTAEELVVSVPTTSQHGVAINAIVFRGARAQRLWDFFGRLAIVVP
jgi:hypothetical protein